jgi:curved DNA-binding protein CbpA
MDRKKIIILLLIALLISLGIIVVFMQNKSNKAEVIKPIARNDDSNLLTVENKREKFDIIKIMDNGDDSDKLVIVIMGDGYTSEELGEFGHTYAELADEYPYAENELYSRSEAPNITRDNNIESIKWKSFIGKNGIGIYEMLEENGGWYKPSRYCRMGSSDVDFCDVCKDEIEKRIVAETMKGTISPDIKSIIDKGK